MDHPNKQFLVQSDWLSDHLNDDNVQIFDCTVYLLPTTDPKNNVYDVDSGRQDYLESHIPGAGFLDLVSDFSESPDDEATDYPFTILSKNALSERASRMGLDKSKRIVLYSNARDAGILFAFRAWWVLRECGFKNLSVLDGGFAKWQAEGRETAQGAEIFAETRCLEDTGPAYFCARGEVIEALDDADTVLVNALPKDNFDGTSGHHYGRPGRITGSVNVPMGSLFNEFGCLKSAAELQKQFSDAGIDSQKKVIAYCGSGIAACAVSFALALLDHKNITIYDRSLLEWSRDHSLPMEV